MKLLSTARAVVLTCSISTKGQPSKTSIPSHYHRVSVVRNFALTRTGSTGRSSLGNLLQLNCSSHNHTNPNNFLPLLLVGLQGSKLQSFYRHIRISFQLQHLSNLSSSNNSIAADMADSTTEKKKVCIVGSGNWGSAIAKIIGNNVKGGDTEFNSTVNMYVYEEIFDGKKLSEIINNEHENKKYLPGIKLPENVKAVTDLPTAADGADILVFVVPHQFIRGLCKQLLGNVKKGAMAVSLIKGLDVKDGGGLLLISDVITECISVPCHVLMGANLAPEVAAENYCEATIGSRDVKDGLVLKRLLQANYFRLVVVEDAVTVEICGALKNIVAVGAGFADGLGYGDNTKAAVIRLGLMEMIKFVDTFYEGTKSATFLESCGVADLVTTCYGGRNRKVAEAMVKTKKSIEELEKEMLNGQKLQGPPTALEVNVMLKAKNMEDTFPLFTAVHRICLGELKPEDFIDCLKNHPEHL